MTGNDSGGQPPGDTLDTIATVLMARWRAATAHPQRLFWPRSGEWLSATALTGAPAAGSPEAPGAG